jgi:GT2 family glycosyltransferase/glycosyltransferase involved in cell wall biosynthesis
MKDKLRESVPLSFKIFLKRMAVGAVRLPLRLGGRLVNAGRRIGLSATTHGLDVHRAWDIAATPRTKFVQEYGATDFLFLMDAIAGRKDRRPDPDRPITTSIILLCYNKIDLTFQCLRSLLREVNLADTEIIVVNNNSTDETREVLALFDGFIRVLNNAENVGFVYGNNKGAALARGKYLVFINNDTVVLPGWLDEMVKTAEDDPQVGVVGPMFIYPDWTIQEAGGIVWRNADAHHYGWGRSPDDPRFNFAREVDYITGASLLIRKDLWDGLGGFDTRYAPIYYEDTDICFGVRARGFKVIYQPLSRILHFEGATTGTDTSTGTKRFQVINREKFHEKWREVLERDHFAPGEVTLERAANRKAGVNVLVFDDRFPTPDRDAGSARMALILKALARLGQCTFISLGKLRQPEFERQLRGEGVEIAPSIDYKRLLKTRRFDVALLSRADVAGGLLNSIKRTAPRIKTIFDTVDIAFVRLEREFELAGDKQTARAARRYKRLERRLAQSCDQVWCVTAEDQAALAREAPAARFAIVPTIHPLQDRGKSFAEREGLIFIGNYTHRPNVDAVQFFMREIYPKIERALPGIKVFIVGDSAPPEFAEYQSDEITVTGYVADVGSLFQRCRIFIAPLRFGSGIKGKIGQALSYGLPVVTTSMGAEGMNLENRREVLIANGADEFAAGVIDLYSDAALWQQLSDNGYRHTAKHFAPEIVEEKIRAAIDAVLSESQG